VTMRAGHAPRTGSWQQCPPAAVMQRLAASCGHPVRCGAFLTPLILGERRAMSVTSLQQLRLGLLPTEVSTPDRLPPRSIRPTGALERVHGCPPGIGRMCGWAPGFEFGSCQRGGGWKKRSQATCVSHSTGMLHRSSLLAVPHRC
jgi:hypothetical protein